MKRPLRNNVQLLAGGSIYDVAFKPPSNFSWQGGPVLPNVDIFPIFFGAYPYTAQMSDLYKRVVVSPYIAWLNEYSTPLQTIGYGSFQGSLTVTSTSVLPSPSIPEARLKKYIMNLIADGTIRASSNLYVPFHFPSSLQVIPQDASNADYCGYHGSIDISSLGLDTQYVTFGVLGDISHVAGCGADPLSAIFSTSCHELLETITDPLVDVATFQPVLHGWIDSPTGPNASSLGEIADVCNGGGAPYTFDDGKMYVLEKGWSNKYKSCIAYPVGQGPYETLEGSPGGAVGEEVPVTNLFAAGLALL
ncbi:hypothetical protein DFJ73DRAFT_841195 [Zopfochytrium polystomum]|nr:hypothetical protein DFJ73DRAFT_841195 [Zopfochytrium polystomum]